MGRREGTEHGSRVRLTVHLKYASGSTVIIAMLLAMVIAMTLDEIRKLQG